MKAKRSLFILIALLSSFEADAKITTSKVNDDGMMVLKLAEGKPGRDLPLHTPGRKRRSTVNPSTTTGPGTAGSGTLGVHTTILPDSNHNEAIVHWTGANSSVMFILSRQHGLNGSVPSSKLWRSTNYGKSFSPAVGFPAGAIVAYYLAAPSDKKKLIFVDQKNHMLYTTENEGGDYQPQIGCGTSSDKITFHPTKPNFLLCYCEAERKLYVSGDFAVSWDLVATYVNPRFFWGVQGFDDELVIHMETFDPASFQFRYKAVSCSAQAGIKDVTLDPDLGPIQVDSLLVMNEYIFVQKASQYATWLYVSWQRKPFRMAYFPKNHHPENLNIINADESQVFVAGSQPSSSFFYTISTLYLSDVTGQFYTTSLESVTDVGLREIQGLRGVFTANQKKGMGATSGLQSVITFDQGGNWSKIPAPETDGSGNPTNCKIEQKCSLHLTHVVSETNAPGMLIGMGNYGELLKGYTNIQLLMSTDGGVSWKFVLSQHDRYEANILDQGGAVVVVPQLIQQKDQENLIHYTHDEGLHWLTYAYTNDSMRVDAVLNDPGIETRTVVIFGHDESKPGWVIVMVDFSDLLHRQCDERKDYADWFPTDMVPGHQCLLGQKMTYRRRNATAECYNGGDYEHAVHIKLCRCILEDYECDYGYEQSADQKCHAAKWFNPDRPVTSCIEGSMYNKSTGYRKVASDKCSPEMEELKPVSTTCPKMKADGLHLMLDGQRVLHVAQTAQFTLVQERGSKISTKYSWNFGDGTPAETYDGFENGSKPTHSYSKRGTYQATVTANNGDGSTSVTLNVLVEDTITGLKVNIPHGSQINIPVLFEVTLSDQMDTFFASRPGVHYLWKFGDEVQERDSLLTWDTSVHHTYKEAKNYTVFVEAMNGGDSIFRLITIPVYGTLTTLQLTFEETLDVINDGTTIWLDLFGQVLHEALANYLNLDVYRLEVVVLKDTTRTVAEVSIIPTKQDLTSDATIDTISKQIQKLPSSKFVVKLSREDFRVDSTQPYFPVKVTTVQVLQVDPDGSGSNNYMAVYVCVPILVAAIFVSMLVVLYYKRTFSRQARRYRLLRGQQTDGPEPDSLLDDTDDDDPPLDLNISDRHQRLALSDDDQLVRGASDPLGLLSSDRRNLDV